MRRAGDLIFVPAQVAVGDDGRASTVGDVRAQAEFALDRLAAELDAAGATLDHVVDVVSFHEDVRQIPTVLDVARRRLGPNRPAWTPITATEPGPPGAAVSIKAVADVSAEEPLSIVPDSIAWWRRLPAAAGCRKGGVLWIAGQYGSDPDGNVNTPGDHAGQARNALNRVKEICELAGGTLDDVAHVLSLHQDPRGIELSRGVYEAEFFGAVANPPAWTAAGTPGVYRFGMLGQYRAIADLSSARRVVAVTDAAPADDVRAGDPEHQAQQSLAVIGAALEAAGASSADVAEVVVFHKDPRSNDALLAASSGMWDPARAPAWTSVGMTGFRHESCLHAVHALAVLR